VLILTVVPIVYAARLSSGESLGISTSSNV
jgi:hypothetical protein